MHDLIIEKLLIALQELNKPPKTLPGPKGFDCERCFLNAIGTYGSSPARGTGKGISLNDHTTSAQDGPVIIFKSYTTISEGVVNHTCKTIVGSATLSTHLTITALNSLSGDGLSQSVGKEAMSYLGFSACIANVEITTSTRTNSNRTPNSTNVGTSPRVNSRATTARIVAGVVISVFFIIFIILSVFLILRRRRKSDLVRRHIGGRLKEEIDRSTIFQGKPELDAEQRRHELEAEKERCELDGQGSRQEMCADHADDQICEIGGPKELSGVERRHEMGVGRDETDETDVHLSTTAART